MAEHGDKLVHGLLAKRVVHLRAIDGNGGDAVRHFIQNIGRHRTHRCNSRKRYLKILPPSVKGSASPGIFCMHRIAITSGSEL